MLTDKFKEFDSSFSKALRAEVSWHMGAVTIKEFFDDLHLVRRELGPPVPSLALHKLLVVRNPNLVRSGFCLWLLLGRIQ